MGAHVATSLRVETAVTAFLGAAGEGPEWRLSGLLRESELTRTQILSFSPDPDPAAARAAAGEVAAVLSADPGVAWVRAGPPQGVEEAFHALYWPRRLLLLADDPEAELPARLEEGALRSAAARLVRELRGPLGPLVKRVAGGDPLLLYPDRLRRIEAGQSGGLSQVEERLVAGDGWSVVFLASRAGPFDTAAQRALEARLEAACAAAARQRPGLRLERSGVARVALASEASIKADVTRISTLSTAGIVLVFLLLYRSLRVLAVALLPLVASLLVATSVGLLLFGRLHSLTLAFGSTLLGVAIDYPMHLVNHHALDGRPAEALRQTWPALLLGAACTAVAFLGVTWTSFPGVREAAVFAIAGVVGALLATRWLVAPLLPAPVPVPLRDRAAAALARGLERLRARRGAVIGLLLAALLLCALGLPRLRWVDEARQVLYRVEPALQAEQERVWARVQRPDGARFVVLEAPDEEAALRLSEAASRRLRGAVAADALLSFRAVGDLLPSAELQARNWEALQATPDLGPRLERALQAEGFRPAAFAAWREALAGPRPAPLLLDELLASPLAELVRPFVLQREPGRVALLIHVRGVRDGAALEAALADLPRLGSPGGGALYFDQDAFLARGYARHRVEILELVAGGLVGVLCLIVVRYRSLRVTLAAFLPALLAGGCTLAIRGALGLPAQLLDAVALLLVLGMGIDYGIYLAEGREETRRLPATLLSLVVACLITVLGYGLLALSPEPTLRAIGLTVGLGVLANLLLAPLALLVSWQEPAP